MVKQDTGLTLESKVENDHEDDSHNDGDEQYMTGCAMPQESGGSNSEEQYEKETVSEAYRCSERLVGNEE